MRIRVQEESGNPDSITIKRELSDDENARQVELITKKSLAGGAPF